VSPPPPKPNWGGEKKFCGGVGTPLTLGKIPPPNPPNPTKKKIPTPKQQTTKPAKKKQTKKQNKNLDPQNGKKNHKRGEKTFGEFGLFCGMWGQKKSWQKRGVPKPTKPHQKKEKTSVFLKQKFL